jgi:hypothetical protein
MDTLAILKRLANYGGYLVKDVQSSTIGATATTYAVTPGGIANMGTNAHSFNVIVTGTPGGTNPTMDVAIEESPDNGTSWIRIYEFQRITAAGAYTTPAIRSQFGTRFRYVQTLGGTDPSFVRAINRIQFSNDAQFIRQFVDRSLASAQALAATTPITGAFVGGYNVDGATTIQMTVNMGAITTTAPQFILDGSEDGANWYPMGTALTSVASSTVVQAVSTYIPKFVRARVSTAGVAATLGYVSIKAFGK